MKTFLPRPFYGCAPLVLVAAAFLLGGCDQPLETEDAHLRPVRYLVIEQPVKVRTRTFTGTSKSALESRLSFKVPGTVVNIPVQVGNTLAKGALVAALDPSQYELRVQQAQAALLQSEASARNAQANYDRIKELYENSNASRNDLDSARASAESAEAQVRAGEKSLQLAQLDLSYTRLRVEQDCSIAEVMVEENENVNAGTHIAKVNCGDEQEVVIDMPEGMIADIRQGMPVVVHFDALSGNSFSGRVIEIGVSASEAATTFPVSIRLDKHDAELRSGLAAEVTFSFAIEADEKHYRVPLAAVIKDPDGAFVFVAVPEQSTGEATIRRQSVQLGELTDEGMEVLSGVSPGDRVVTAGVSVIRNGQRVLLP
ncbi:MAG: efflux RND transporter periplasmic adaptor subunit [Pseudomonadales bacterium]|jgi:RND family efflux transporter MFP subunit